jgi:DNA-binding protein H-NS
MSKLTDLRKKIAALEAEFARTAKAEMEASVNKVKGLMASLGVTIEHLGMKASSTIAKKTVSKKVPAKQASSKRAGVGVPKYMDPKTGKTWTGFGRAPGWIAGANNRDAFLVDKSAAVPAADAKIGAKKAKTQKAVAAPPAKKASARAARKAAPAKTGAPASKTAAKKAVVKATASKKPVAKKAVAKKIAKKTVAASANSASTGATSETTDTASA